MSNSLGITDTATEELEYLPEPLPIIAMQSVPKKFNSNDRVMIDTDADQVVEYIGNLLTCLLQIFKI